MNPQEIHQLLRSRRAIRRYTQDPVSEKMITRLLQTAVWAPSAHNRQPWRFAILTQFADKEKLALAMGARLRADRTADQDDPTDIERDVARSYARLTEAPVLIIICLSMSDMDSYPDKHRATAERTMTVQSVAMAAQNLWFAAHAEGLGCCWLCAPLFVPQLVQQTLALPEDWEPQGLLTIGWPAQQKTKTRAPLESKLLFL